MKTRTQAIAAWNTRHREQELVEALERIARWFETMAHMRKIAAKALLKYRGEQA